MGKIIKRTLLGLLILIVLVLGAAILLPIIYKTKIIEFAKSEANRRINAKLNFSNDISIGILKTFPDLNITINNITLVNNKPFAGDTLISIVEFKSTMDVMSIIKGDKIKIKTLVLNHPRIFMKKLIDGTANWSIAFPSNEDIKAQGKDTGSNFKMGLQHYEINNGYVVFDDATHTFYAKMVNLNHSGNGDFTADNLDLNTETTADAITMIYDKIPYLYNTKTQLKAAINIDQISKYTLKENELHLNDLLITFGGWVAMPDDDINMDMNFKSPQTDFKSILSLIPAVYKKDFSKIKASGSMAMKGDIKGTYNDKSFPGFNVLLNVDNGMFSYPDLPTPVKDVFVNMTAQSPGGDFNNAVINISKLHFAMGDDPFDIRMLIKTPTTDPYLDGAIKGKIILDNIKNMVKLDAGTSISGILKSDILMKGNLSSIEKKEYDKFNFSGNITCENLGYTSASLPQKMHISHTSMDFNPKNVKLNDLSMTIGNSDMQMDGYLNNLLGYFFKKGQTLKGELNLTAKLIDCNQFLSKSTAKEASHEDPNAKPSAVELPGDIDFTLKAKLGEVKYEKFDFKNLRGQITLADKRITFKDAALSLMDATCNIDGYYDSKNIKEPKV
ncbi:MAG: AsmA family protein, partial [Bacteroidetes bacterium]|nr:AsmA family protein [Bacteroidota bacterium]